MAVQPLANDFTKPDQPRAGFAPLAVLFCPACSLAQLSVTVDPEILYAQYTYVTSTSDTMRRHFHRLLQDICSEGVGRTLLEIGSNDGAFLKFAKAERFDVRGIDPARNLAALATADGIMTTPEPFTAGTAAMATGGDKAALILARHCFCHIDDWYGFVAGLGLISHPETLICIEVPHVHDLLSKTEFDTIYHEHTSYLSVKAMAALLSKTDFHIHRVIRYGVHGGCILIMLRHNASKVERHLSADEYLNEETVTLEHWQQFETACRDKIDVLRSTVKGLAMSGKIVCGYGASAKSTVLIQACGFTKKEVRFITDNSPHKPGRLSPGSEIPVIDEQQLLSEHPDYAIMCAWNYQAEILEKNRRWRERGGKFLIPGKTVEIV